jgi:hypothetical protein
MQELWSPARPVGMTRSPAGRSEAPPPPEQDEPVTSA